MKEEHLSTEKIINARKLTNYTNKGRDKNKFNELEVASKLLVDFINKYYNPMTIAIVREGRVEILSEEMGMPLEVRD